MQGDDPPFLPVGTDVSAKYKGAFCEAKIKKVVRNIKCKVTFKATGIGSLTVTDDAIKGTLRVGNTVEVKHEQKKEMMEAIITKMQDCSQYTVVFDDGDITTLRRSALCLKSGRHFNESETLDQLPLTHPEHFSTPVIGHSAGRRRRGRAQSEESWSDGDERGGGTAPTAGSGTEREPHAGRVVLVECASGGGGGRRAQTAFPGLVVAPTAQDTVKIKVKDEYLVRSFKDGRYYTVPKKEAREFKRGCAPPEWGGVEAALQFLNADTLPAHWDRDALFATDAGRMAHDEDTDDSSDDEPREEKDHFVAQLYKFMDDRGTPLNRNPTIANRDIDLYRLFRVVQKLGGCNRVTNQNQWKTIAAKMGFHSGTSTITNLCKQAYKKFLHSFEDFYRKLGVTLVAHPRGGRTPPSGRSLIRDRDRAPPTTAQPAAAPAPPPQAAPTESAVVKEEKPTPEVSTKVSTSRAAKEKDKEAEKLKEKEAPAKEKEKEKERESKAIKSEKINTSDEDSGDNQPLVTTVRSEKGETEKTPERSAKAVKNNKGSIGAESKRGGRKDTGASHAAQRRIVKGRQTSREPPPVAVKTVECRPKAASEPNKRSSERDKHSREKETPSRKQASTDSDSSGRGSRCAVANKNTPSRRSQSANSASSTNTVSSNSSKKPKKRKITGSQQSDTSKVGSNTINAVVGDKLKVYYGPAHSESKVTYEAKVIEVSGRGADTLLRVHYTGWNTRYDEWIRPARIALNITHDQGKNKHKDKERMLTSSKRTRAPPSASKPHTRNRTGSNATTASNSQHTDASVQSDTDSDSGSEQETSPPPQKRPAHDDKSSSAPNNACKEKPITPNTSNKELPVSPLIVKKEACPTTTDKQIESTDGKESPDKTLASSNKSVRLSRASAQLGNKRPATSEVSPVRAKRSRVKVEEETPKGRDFDLNEIRSELKGLDIKNVIKSPVDNVRIEQEDMVIEKEEPIILVKTEKTPEKVTEDIYEFKEPEPFEFEARKSEEKKKRIPTHRIFDDLPQLKLSPTRSPEKSSPSPTGNKPTKSQYEEAFDKLCQSESYDNTDATEEPAEKEGETLSLFDELAGEDSGDRLVISEAEDSQEPLFTYENELFPADKNLLPIFKAFTPAKNQETYSKKDTTVKLPDIVDEFTNSPIKEDQSSDEDPIDAAIQRVNTLPPSSDDSIDGDLLIKSTTTTISLLKPYSPKPEVKPVNPISEALAPVIIPEKIIEIPKKEEIQEANETTVITTVKANDSPTINATSPTVEEEVVTIKLIEKEIPKSPQDTKEPDLVNIKETVPDINLELEVLKPGSPTHEHPVQPITVKPETPPHPVKMKTDIEMSPLVSSNAITDIMLSDNEDLKKQNKSDSECSTFVDVVIPEPPAGFLMHKEGPSIADKVLKAISSAKKAASLSPPFTNSKDNSKPSKTEGSKALKTEISKCNKNDGLKILPTSKVERVKSPSGSKTDSLKPLNKCEVPVKSIIKLDPPVIGDSVFGVEVPVTCAELDNKLEVSVAKVEPVNVAPLKVEVVERRKSGPEIPLPVIGKNNRVLSETIQKLSSQISQPPAIPVASFQPEDTSDSDDSDQRLIIDKLSEDESQSGASSSETAGKPPATWGTREETARQAEEDSNISLLLCEETIPGSPAPAERETKQTQGKPKSARSLQMPFASAPSNSPEQAAGKVVATGKGGEGVWEGLHELVPERRGVLDNTPPTTPDTSLDNMSPHRDNPMSDGEGGLDSKACDEDIRNPGTSKKMSDMDKSTNAGGRSRKASESSCAGGRRGRRPRRHSDSEDADSTSTTLVTPSHHQRPLKYNFYVDLDPSWDCNARITLITSQLGELRKAYHGLKAELAAIDRRRKKLRRKEREENLKPSMMRKDRSSVRIF